MPEEPLIVVSHHRVPESRATVGNTGRDPGGVMEKLAANSGGSGSGEKARVSSRGTPSIGFSKRTALNSHERVFRSSVPARTYIRQYICTTIRD